MQLCRAFAESSLGEHRLVTPSKTLAKTVHLLQAEEPPADAAADEDADADAAAAPDAAADADGVRERSERL